MHNNFCNLPSSLAKIFHIKPNNSNNAPVSMKTHNSFLTEKQELGLNPKV